MTATLHEAEILAPGEGKTVSLPGATMAFKALSGVGTTDFRVGELTTEPGFAAPRPHAHRRHGELCSVLDGEFEIFIKDRALRIGPGVCVTVPPRSRPRRP